jgi:multimeric flavodoxin WrbA
MPRLLILYDSMTGGTAAMAQAAHAGAAAEAQVQLTHVSAAGPEDLRRADGVIFACPENLAALSGGMKALFDRCYYPLLDAMAGRPYAMMICAGSDGSQAARQMTRILTGWRMTPVADPVIICTHAQTPEAILAPKKLPPEDLARCHDLGALLAAGLALGIY